jgi:hypothetical protein
MCRLVLPSRPPRLETEIARLLEKAGSFRLMEKIEEKRYNSLGFSPKLDSFYQF